MEFRDALVRALDTYLQDPSSLGLTSDLAILAQAHNALPVYADMGGALLIRSTGEVLLVHSNQEWTASAESSVVTDAQWIAVAYTACEKRFPPLRGLRPSAGEVSRLMEDLKQYDAIVWLGDGAGQRLTLLAKNPKDALKQIESVYGEGVVATVRNEEDAKRPR
jgi:hypothetical protein